MNSEINLHFYHTTLQHTTFNFLCSFKESLQDKNLLHVDSDGLDKKKSWFNSKYVTCLQQFNQVFRFNFYLISYTYNQCVEDRIGIVTIHLRSKGTWTMLIACNAQCLL